MFKGSFAASGKRRWWCRVGTVPNQIYCYSTTNPEAAKVHTRTSARIEAQTMPEFEHPGIEGAQTLIITTAQNATPVWRPGWDALQRYAKSVGAVIVVIPLRYSNPTSIWSAKAKSNMWWDDAFFDVREGRDAQGEKITIRTNRYLHNQRTQLNPNLALLADINVTPTNSNPLSGMEGFTGHASGIVGHMRAETTTIATPGHKMAKLMTTTGAITKSNYIPSNIGKKGEHHHVFGALIVEMEGGLFWCRRLNMDSRGSFIDYDKRVTRKTVTRAPRPLAVELGDTHHAVTDPEVDRATFGARGLVPTLRPRRVLWNDVLDGQSHNPHERHDPFVEAALDTTDRNNVKTEVDNTITFIKARTPSWAVSYIKASNHDDFLRRWVIDVDWKKIAVKNRSFYLEMARIMHDNARVNEKGFHEYPSPFPWCVERAKLKNVVCLRLSDPLTVGKYFMAYHGHKGSNGARGSLRSLSRIGPKVVIAHGHGPGEKDGSVQVGHSAREGQPYQAGSPSSGMHAHAIIQANGKAQLIFIVEGRTRR